MCQQVEAVQRMQDYIDANLTQNITLADLAKASLFSPWYSYRLFLSEVGLSPADYIRKLRLSMSAIKLRDSACRITDVAFDMGFGSVDGYQRAFRREFGCNPGEYAKKSIPIHLFTPYGVKFRQIKRRTTVENVRNVFIQVIEKPARKVIIKRGIKATDYFAYCEEVGCEVWGLLKSIQSLDKEPVSLWLPPSYQKAGTSVYVQGAEVAPDIDVPIPEGFDVIQLPAATYLMFQGEPFMEEDYCRAIDELQLAINQYDPTLIGYTRDSQNPRIQLEPIGTRGYIELLPVKKS